MPQNLMLDSVFWIGLYDTSDEHHDRAVELALYFDYCHLLIPWPALYETLGTRFVRRPQWLRRFELLLHKPGTVRLPDERYRDQALAHVLRLNRGGRGMSLVDMVIRAMIEDVNMRIDALMTFNRPDFLDVCLSRHVEILSD